MTVAVVLALRLGDGELLAQPEGLRDRVGLPLCETEAVKLPDTLPQPEPELLRLGVGELLGQPEGLRDRVGLPLCESEGV